MTLTTDDIDYIKKRMLSAGPSWLRLQLRLTLEALEEARAALTKVESP